jgi:predicted Rossmann fold flavoprotein
MDESAWQVVVVGAGAAGLFAAIQAAERGRRTLLLEKNRKPGVKILMSGGTRCNLTHATDNRGIVGAFGPPGRFLHSALAAFGVEETIAFFEAEGVPTKVEETGKVFPISNKALDVLDALLRRLHRSGATLALEEAVQDIQPLSPGFAITTPRRRLTAGQLIVTTGGLSYPGSGTTGDGYGFAAHFGHTIVPPRPALAPITISAPWLGELRGITIPDVGLKILEEQKCLATRRGSLLFAHFGLTGPVALDVSRAVSGHSRPQSLVAEIDLVPALKEGALNEDLRGEAIASGKKQVAALLAARLPRRLCDILVQQAGVPLERKAAELSKTERTSLVLAIQRLPVPITGTLGFRKAEVTAGGVALDEVDSRTMRSKCVSGLYIAGEVLDLDGPIGGYNFQSAFSTGWLAGAVAGDSR